MVWEKIPHPEYANTEVFQLGLGMQHQERVTPKIISNRCLNLDPLQNGAGPVAIFFFLNPSLPHVDVEAEPGSATDVAQPGHGWGPGFGLNWNWMNWHREVTGMYVLTMC